MPQEYLLAAEFSKPDLERDLIASLATAPDTYWQVMDLLAPQVFTEYAALFQKLALAIEQEKELPAVSGTPLADPEGAASELADLYQKRLLSDLGQTFLRQLNSKETNATELMGSLENDITKVQQVIREIRAGQLNSLVDLFPEILQDIAKRWNIRKEKGTAILGLSTGITKLDRILGGLQTGIHLLAAEPGKGKTSFTMQIARNVARSGYPVLFVSFEEAPKRLALKSLCAAAGLEAKRFEDGYGDPQDLDKAAREFGPSLAGVYFMEGLSSLPVSAVKAKALSLMTKKRTDKCLIIIDYLQRWANMQRGPAEMRFQVSDLVSGLREISLRLDSPVLVISSQNRDGQGGASLTSFKESGDLEYSADSAMFLVDSDRDRVVVPPARAVDLALKKNRYGDTERIELIFKPHLGVFAEEAKR